MKRSLEHKLVVGGNEVQGPGAPGGTTNPALLIYIAKQTRIMDVIQELDSGVV